MDRDSEDNSSSQSQKSDSDDSNLSNVSSVSSDDDPTLDILKHESYKSYSDDNSGFNSLSECNTSDEENSNSEMLEENNNDPNNNMDNENREGENVSLRVPSPQPGCSRHFDSVENGHTSSFIPKLSVEQINIIADNILLTIKQLLSSINHESIVNVIQRNLRTGKNKLCLGDLLPSEFNLQKGQKRQHAEEDISGLEMKKAKVNNVAPPSPMLAGFMAGNPIDIDNFPKSPLRAKSPNKLNDAMLLPNQNTSVEIIDEGLPIIRKATQLLANNKMKYRIPETQVAQATTKFTVAHVDQLKRPSVNVPATVTSNAYKSSVTVPPKLIVKSPAKITTTVTGSSSGNKVTIGGRNYWPLNHKLSEGYIAELRRVKHQLALERQMINNLPVTTRACGFKEKIDKINSINRNQENNINMSVLIAANRLLQPPSFTLNQPQFIINDKNKFCEEIYRKLRAMFPDIDREYIKTFCPADWAPEPSHDIQFGTIVEKILQNEGSWVMDVNENNFLAEIAEDDGLTPNVDDSYEYLTGIFPNADPHYLRSAAENFKNENDVKTFVDTKLKSNDYPTREQYLAKIKVTEEQQRYTKNFNVEQFLNLFPDPFAHFEDEKRKCEFNLIVVEFLKNEFSRIRVNTISRVYRRYSYNLSIAAKILRLSRDFIVNPRRPSEIPTENIPLLQEMAFVRHHETIRQHMMAVKQREEEEFNSLKAAGSLWTCQCCYDDECMPSKCSTCDNAHVFCNSCVVNGTDSRLGDGETHVPCFLNCGSEFSISTLQKVLAPTKFSILLKKRQAAEVMAAGLEGLVSCPFCHFASIPPEGDKVFKCLNPECMKESCIQCKEPNHVPFKCGELDKKDKARKYIEEKMTQALTRTCYQCKRAFFKEEGCNKMTCPCGAMMCYICNQPVKDYHHFRGQGSTEVDKCPLWSDNKRLNAETVRKVEEDARREILRQDPTLDIGTTALAPALPPPTAGPHRDIPEIHNIANMLAARVLHDPADLLLNMNPNNNHQ